MLWIDLDTITIEIITEINMTS